MKLEDQFELNAAPDRVWDVLNDVELIAPYVPGFTLTESDGDTFRGTMKVKLGAVTVQYETEITIAVRDPASRTVLMRVAGRERRGTGRMKASVSSRLEPSGDATAVQLETDLELTGKIAQMGRGMIADVNSSLLGDFVRSLEANVLTVAPVRADAAAPPAAESARPADEHSDVVDLTGVAGRSAAKRLGPIVVAVIAVLVVLRLRAR